MSPVAELISRTTEQAQSLVSKAVLARTMEDLESSRAYSEEALTLYVSVADFCARTYKGTKTITALVHRNVSILALGLDKKDMATQYGLAALMYTHDEKLRNQVTELVMKAACKDS